MTAFDLTAFVSLPIVTSLLQAIIGLIVAVTAYLTWRIHNKLNGK